MIIYIKYFNNYIKKNYNILFFYKFYYKKLKYIIPGKKKKSPEKV